MLMEFRYHIHIMTLFPDVVGDMLCESIWAALKNGILFGLTAIRFGITL